MPSSYRIDADAKIVFSDHHGCLTDGDLLEHLDGLCADRTFESHFRQLADFRGVTSSEVTVEMVRHLATRNPFGAGARRAGVAESLTLFGLLRMFEMLTERSANEVEVFTDFDAARKWLGLD
jgi:hypothetical protein